MYLKKIQNDRFYGFLLSCQDLCLLSWRYDREGDTALFFWNIHLFEITLIFKIIVISLRFKNARFRFWYPLLLKLSRVRRKRNKKYDFVKIFLFQIFENFASLEIGFSINLNKGFCLMINFFGVTLLFYFSVSLHKVLLSNTEGILSYMGIKKSYYTWQKHGMIWSVSLSYKN